MHSAMAFAPRNWEAYTTHWEQTRKYFESIGFSVEEVDGVTTIYRKGTPLGDTRSRLTMTMCSDYDTFEGWQARGRAVKRGEYSRSGQPYFDFSARVFHISQTYELHRLS